MIFLIKDINYFNQLIEEFPNSLHINNNNKNSISVKNLYDVILNNLYKNIFFHTPTYLDFLKNINFNKFENLNIYILVNNINYISLSLLLKSQIVMEKKDCYYPYIQEIEKFLNNKNYHIECPSGALRYYLISIMEKIPKESLKKFVKEINNIFFYTDKKIQLHMLYILNEEIKFYNDKNS